MTPPNKSDATELESPPEFAEPQLTTAPPSFKLHAILGKYLYDTTLKAD